MILQPKQKPLNRYAKCDSIINPQKDFLVTFRLKNKREPFFERLSGKN